MIPGIIKFSDPTVIEGHENFQEVKAIMEREGPPVWMLRTNVTVVTENIASNFVLHLWNDGRAVIVDTNHSITIEAPDDDFRRMSNWCHNQGWKLEVDRFLLDNKQHHEFWMRLFRAGLVHSDVLYKLEQDEMARMQLAYEKDLKEDENEEEIYYGN